MFDFNQLSFNPDGGVDLDGDGVSDTILLDTNGNGVPDTMLIDTDGNGSFDATYVDTDENGSFDVLFLDTDDNGVNDILVNFVDEDNNGIFDIVEFYSYDEEYNTIELLYTDDFVFDGSFFTAELPGLENFDPDSVNPDVVSGNPEQAMEEWEFQGDTNRCALYSQKFIIEEITGEELDIEDIADLAEENGWFTEENGTMLLDMNRVLDYYGIENEMTFNNNIDILKDCLDAGGKVIVSVDSGEIWYGEEDSLFVPDDGADHAVEVIGIDYSDPNDPMVILNDSGSPNGCGEMVPLDTFVDAWEDGGCQMVSCM